MTMSSGAVGTSSTARGWLCTAEGALENMKIAPLIHLLAWGQQSETAAPLLASARIECPRLPHRAEEQLLASQWGSLDSLGSSFPGLSKPSQAAFPASADSPASRAYNALAQTLYADPGAAAARDTSFSSSIASHEAAPAHHLARSHPRQSAPPAPPPRSAIALGMLTDPQLSWAAAPGQFAHHASLGAASQPLQSPSAQHATPAAGLPPSAPAAPPPRLPAEPRSPAPPPGPASIHARAAFDLLMQASKQR